MKSDNSDSDSSEEFYDAEAPRYVSTATLCGIILELELKRKRPSYKFTIDYSIYTIIILNIGVEVGH